MRPYLIGCVASMLAFVAVTDSASAASIVYHDAVFAYDMEQVIGDSVENISLDPTTGLIDGTKLSTMSISSSDPLMDGTQHLRPSGGGLIDSNIKLTAPDGISALSFSMFIRDNGAARSKPVRRFLSTYIGSGSLSADDVLFDALATDATSDPLTRLRFVANGETVILSDTTIAALEDGEWHQVGMVFNAGTVQFYFDGTAVGAEQAIATAIVPGQGSNWHVYEDVAGSSLAESFIRGDYDNTGLWYRALTAAEMQALYTTAIPEPASLALLGLGGALMLFRRRA